MIYSIRDVISTNDVGDINLTDRDFVSEGGEGRVYRKGDFAYKIYHKPARAIPIAKARELTSLEAARPAVMYPLRAIYNKHNELVGYVYYFVDGAVALCKIFTNDYIGRMGINTGNILTMATEMATTICAVHSRDILIVDGNEFNYLFNEANRRVYFIDVDSYQTRNFPATAIMPSIRDWHTKGFNEGSDWFSFAVVSFQMFTGIHPYKGTHPKFARNDIEGRMKANASVFDKGVSLPKTMRPISGIPTSWAQWYRAVLKEGKRVAPPAKPGTYIIPTIVIQKVVGTLLMIEELAEFDSPALFISEYGDVITELYINRGLVRGPQISYTNDKVVVSKNNVNETILVGKRNANDCPLTISNGLESVAHSFRADDITTSNGVVLVKYKTKLMELVFDKVGKKNIASVGMSWDVLEHATTLYNGVVYQNVLGMPYILITYKKNGQTASLYRQLPELRDYRIVSMKQEKKVLQIIGFLNGRYDLWTFVFPFDYSTPVSWVKEDVGGNYDINSTVLDNGILVSMNENGDIEITNTNKAPKSGRVINDPAVDSTFRLHSNGCTVLAISGKKVYKLSVK